MRPARSVQTAERLAWLLAEGSGWLDAFIPGQRNQEAWFDIVIEGRFPYSPLSGASRPDARKDNTMAIEPEQTTPPLNERQSAVPPVLPEVGAPKSVRLFFLDNLRVLLIMLVIAGHLAATYSGSDVWYYYEPTKDEVASIILSIFGVTVQAFTMGLFFLIAGYLTPGAYDRKGATAFLKGRLLRLGIPLLIYDLFIAPQQSAWHPDFSI